MTIVTISGRVIIEGSAEPLADHEVELWTFDRPYLPIAMGSYTKKTAVRTSTTGLFTITAEVPENQQFELRTFNPASVFGGGRAHLWPANSLTDVTIVHKLAVEPREQRR